MELTHCVPKVTSQFWTNFQKKAVWQKIAATITTAKEQNMLNIEKIGDTRGQSDFLCSGQKQY